MKLEHEYALLGGMNRASIGRWLGSLAALISGGIVFVILSAVDLAAALGWPINLPPTILSLAGAGAVYGVLYWLFDRRIWKFRPLAKLLKVPDLSGKWECVGTPVNSPSAAPWKGKVTIIQSWDRLRIHIETKTSVSDSLSAALLHDEAAGFRLMYHYSNTPRVSAKAQMLAPHHGFAELVFAPGEQSASGDYFNGRGRNTFGTMVLTRMP